MSDALERIADLSPDLKESEVRVLIELTRSAARRNAQGVPMGSRELSRRTKLSRSNVQAAIESLNRSSIITSDSGSATVAAYHKLNFLSTVRIERGPITGPPPVENIENMLQLALFQSQGGSITEPPVRIESGSITEPPPRLANDAGARAHAFGIFDFDSIDIDRLFERLLNAKPSDYTAERLERARAELWGYQAKFGRLPNPHPPDEQTCAQFLSVADWPRLEGLMIDLRCERRQPGEGYQWYVTVAVNRLWHLTPAQQKEHRAKFAIIRASKPKPQQQTFLPTQTDEPFDEVEFRKKLKAAAHSKGMR